MATTIRFTGLAGDTVVVDEDAAAVGRAIAAGPGSAQLTRSADGVPVYVNPAAVAYWFDGVRPERADSGIASSMSPF